MTDNDNTFGKLLSAPDDGPAYAARVMTDDGPTHDVPYRVTGWCVAHVRSGRTVVTGLTEQRAIEIANNYNKTYVNDGTED